MNPSGIWTEMDKSPVTVPDTDQPTISQPVSSNKAKSKRLASIDALRGFDMLWLMQEETGIVVALAVLLHLPFQALIAKEFDHTPWVGLTLWDLIAPLFLFIVGLSLPLAIESRQRRGEGRDASRPAGRPGTPPAETR